ncbi:hypothetical protein CTT31_17695 [Pseudoalteromonas maricaloris]|uniref:hypothetical protein n=1 Tax=Pseudoalteromonas maricaloris TaxID=184924 RepID=UPI0021AE2785|nr:hypothetical protein [Pseudoalteromonas flavipulchra]USE70855.1 hypothetical protein CTT31_17695 [Pseudoalteromonas flavipulchra]
MSREIDKDKIKLAVCLLLWGGLGSYLCQPLIHGNQDAINVIVTVFSILAGFLVAVITLIGDPKSLPAGGWQVARLGSDLTYNRLIRHKWLFKAYLITLFLIFISIVIKNKYPAVRLVLEYTYMFFATISCVLSFKLPSALIELQQERIEHEITERRKREGIDE